MPGTGQSGLPWARAVETLAITHRTRTHSVRIGRTGTSLVAVRHRSRGTARLTLRARPFHNTRDTPAVIVRDGVRANRPCSISAMRSGFEVDLGRTCVGGGRKTSIRMRIGRFSRRCGWLRQQGCCARRAGDALKAAMFVPLAEECSTCDDGIVRRPCAQAVNSRPVPLGSATDCTVTGVEQIHATASDMIQVDQP
jgi:hypothetical protein